MQEETEIAEEINPSDNNEYTATEGSSENKTTPIIGNSTLNT